MRGDDAVLVLVELQPGRTRSPSRSFGHYIYGKWSGFSFRLHGPRIPSYIIIAGEMIDRRVR